MPEITRHFVSRAYIVKGDKVLLIKGKTGHWIPPGGHLKRDELPPHTAVRECEEETGMKIKLIDKYRTSNAKFSSAHVLPQPDHLEVHDVEENHQHIAFIYFARFDSENELVNQKKIKQFRWFTREDLEKETLKDSVKYYGKRAIKELGKEPEPSPGETSAEGTGTGESGKGTPAGTGGKDGEGTKQKTDEEMMKELTPGGGGGDTGGGILSKVKAGGKLLSGLSKVKNIVKRDKGQSAEDILEEQKKELAKGSGGQAEGKPEEKEGKSEKTGDKSAEQK